MVANAESAGNHRDRKIIAQRDSPAVSCPHQVLKERD